MSDNFNTLKEWVENHPLYPVKIDDSMITRFLYVCQNDMQKAKHVTELFLKFRTELVEVYTNRDPTSPEMEKIFDVVDVFPLPERTEEGYQVYVSRFADANPDNFDFLYYSKMFFNISDVRMKCEENIPVGDVPIFDMAGFTLRHLMKFMYSLSLFKKYMRITQEAHPVALKQIHVINTLPILEKVLTFVKPLMREEVKNLIHFHASNSDTLYKFIPKDILPEEYGGKGGSLVDIKAVWKKRILENRDWLMTNPWRYSDGKEKNNNTKGTFKTLALD